MLFLISGCFPEERTVTELPPFIQGINSDREKNGQIYYSLQNRKVVKTNGIYDWDLAFSCKPGDFTILVNSAKRMGVYNTESKEFDIEYNANFKHYDWRYDHPSSTPGGTCIGQWGDFNFKNPQSFGDIYIVNRGYDIYNLPFALQKMRIDGFKNNAYEITFAYVDGSHFEHVSIQKNDSFNYVYVKLDNPAKVLNLEPPKEQWDILISGYMDTLRYSNFYTKPDSINSQLGLYDGVLLNPFNHLVAESPDKSFNNIDFFDVDQFNYMQNPKSIGCKWYDWSQTANDYVISDNHTFIVKEGKLNYYILDFVEIEKPNREKLNLRFAIKNL